MVHFLHYQSFHFSLLMKQIVMVIGLISGGGVNPALKSSDNI